MDGTRSCLGAIMGVAVVAQAGLLIGLEQLSWIPAVIVLVASALAGLAIMRLWMVRHDRNRPVLSMAVVTLTLGGLGMLCGTVLDERGLASERRSATDVPRRARADASEPRVAEPRSDSAAPSLPPCHAARASSVASPPAMAETPYTASRYAWIASWMNLLMLATCIPACALICRCVGPWVHGASGVGMFVGMLAGGAWLGPLLVPWCSPGLASHLSMLAGMTAGTAIAVAASRRVRSRRT